MNPRVQSVLLSPNWPKEDDLALLKPATTCSKTDQKKVLTMAGNNEIEILHEVEIVPDEDVKEDVKR